MSQPDSGGEADGSSQLPVALPVEPPSSFCFLTAPDTKQLKGRNLACSSLRLHLEPRTVLNMVGVRASGMNERANRTDTLQRQWREGPGPCAEPCWLIAPRVVRVGHTVLPTAW